MLYMLFPFLGTFFFWGRIACRMAVEKRMGIKSFFFLEERFREEVRCF